jgi:hypothetical protein
MATQITVNTETLEVIYADWHEYVGEVHYCKGEAKKQMDIENQQMQMQNQLQQQSLANQQKQQGMVNPAVASIIANGGLSPEAEASLRSTAMNTLPQSYNSLYGNLSNQLVQRGITGGGMAGSGDIARNFGALGSQEAGQQAQLLSQIPLQKEQGLYNAFNTALGVGNQFGQNIGTFGAGASSAGGSATSAANTAQQTGSGLFGSIFGGLLSPVKVSKTF